MLYHCIKKLMVKRGQLIQIEHNKRARLEELSWETNLWFHSIAIAHKLTTYLSMGQQHGHCQMSPVLVFTDQLHGELEVSIVWYVLNEGSFGLNKLSKSIEIKTEHSVGLLPTLIVNRNLGLNLKFNWNLEDVSKLEYRKLLWYLPKFVDGKENSHLHRGVQGIKVIDFSSTGNYCIYRTFRGDVFCSIDWRATSGLSSGTRHLQYRDSQKDLHCNW